MQRTRFRLIITGNESWFDLEYQHASQQSVSPDEMPQRVDPAIGTAKFMLTTIRDVNGFHLPGLIPSECRFNAQYFVEHVMAPLVQTVFPQGRARYTPGFNVHLDNCHVDFSQVTKSLFIENQLLHVPTHRIVPTWPRGTSGYSGILRLDSLAEASPSPKNYSNYYKVFENFWREFLLRN
jgi:hypothetical protein